MIAASLLWPRRDGVPACAYALPGTDAAWAGSAPARGRAVAHEATPLPRPSARRMSAGMADLIYGQLHLIPYLVDLGLLTGVQTQEVTLWNATFAPVELLHIAGASPQGTTLSGMEAGTLPPTGVAKGLLTVLESGPAEQDTTYSFVTSIGERRMTITASRVLLFPFWPDWSGGIEQDYAFDTVIARSENGSEQRRPLVKRPLRTLRASVWGDGVNGQRLHNLVRQGKDRVFGVPMWQEALEVESVDAARRVLMVERPFGDCWNLTRLCRLVMLHERRSGVFMVATLNVMSPEGRTLGLAVAVPEIFAAGSTRAIPLFTGILTRAEPSSRSSELETWSLEFRELAGAQPELGGLPHAPGEGPWLWTHRADWSDGVGGASELVRTLRTVRGGIMELGSRRGVAPPPPPPRDQGRGVRPAHPPAELPAAGGGTGVPAGQSNRAAGPLASGLPARPSAGVSADAGVLSRRVGAVRAGQRRAGRLRLRTAAVDRPAVRRTVLTRADGGGGRSAGRAGPASGNRP